MKNILKNYGFIICMLTGIVAGCIVGLVWPGATVLEPLGTLFTNLMFCIVVPMVFCSIASAIANMSSAKRAGKIMGVTIATFCVTAGIAALIMYIIARVFPIVGGAYEIVEGEVVDEAFCAVYTVAVLIMVGGIEGVGNDDNVIAFITLISID